MTTKPLDKDAQALETERQRAFTAGWDAAITAVAESDYRPVMPKRDYCGEAYADWLAHQTPDPGAVPAPEES